MYKRQVLLFEAADKYVLVCTATQELLIRESLRELRRPIPSRLGAGPVAAVLSGCVMDVAFRPTQRATMRVVADAGYAAERTTPAGCCGALAMHYGRPVAAREMAKARIAEMEGAEIVVANASGCSAHMKTYGELLAADPAWAERAERVAARVRDLIELTPPARDAGIGTVAVHDACHHLHAQGIGPRNLLAGAGAHCVDLGDGGRCCGAAGLYSVLQPEMAAKLRRQKAEAVTATGAPVVAVANPGCAIQIAAGLRELGSDVRVAHPAELVSPD